MLRQKPADPFAKTAKALESATRKKDVEFYGRIEDKVLRLIPGQNECNPGIRCVEYNLIIAMPDMPEKSTGGIILAQETLDGWEMAYQVGRIIEASPTAFNYDDFNRDFPELKPRPGDLVWVARYAGGQMVGKDGRMYRIVKDKDVGGVIDPPE